jgi:hypothetical protein
MASSGMPKRSSKKKDINETAFSIVQKVTDQAEPAKLKPEKNPAAVALGRLGGLKGGKARAKKLTPEDRSGIASQAAKIRWAKKVN